MTRGRTIDFGRLLTIREQIGPHYGSEELCMLLYVLAKRERPRVVVELGTGLGVTTAWIAAAIAENGEGHLWSIDDGSHLEQLNAHDLDRLADELGFERGPSLHSFNEGLLRSLHLDDCVTLLDEHLDLHEPAEGRRDWPFLEQPIDWVFADIRHDPSAIEQLLAAFLPHAADHFSLFVDSASTLSSSFLMAERTIDQMNRSKVPQAFTRVGDEGRRAILARTVAEREFALKHLIERRDRMQNSTMWITAYPNDWRPHPATMMRGR